MMQKFLHLAIILVALGISCVETKNLGSSQIDALKSRFLPTEFSNANFTIDDLKRIFHEKCKKSTGSHNATLYKEIEESATTFTNCVSDLINITKIQEEVETARPLGDLDVVFQKHCQQAPALMKCINTFNTKVQPCLTKSELQQNVMFMRIISKLISFMCSKGGDQMALFIAEQGPECLEANKEAITSCANHSFAAYWPKDNKLPDLFNLPEIVLSPEHCLDFERFESCTLHHLEQCRDITPANVAESVFKFIKNETSCRIWIKAKTNELSVLIGAREGGVASVHEISFLTSLAAAAVLIAFLRR